jgi:hypothetical protein
MMLEDVALKKHHHQQQQQQQQQQCLCGVGSV